MSQRFCVFFGSILLAIAAASEGFADPSAGIALVIGESAYPDADAPLSEPVKDARAFADELRGRGFDVIVGENLKKAPMQKALDDFYGKITSSSTAVIFFSGFGIQSDRQSYLLPTDAQVWNESDVQRDGFNIGKILTETANHHPQAAVAFIDASRANPFESRFRSVSAGLAAVAATPGMAVIISALPNKIATTKPSIFVSQLLVALKGSDLTIEQIFNRTSADVQHQTNGEQVPWFSSSLEPNIKLGHPGAQSAKVASAEPAAPPATPSATASKPDSTAAPAADQSQSSANAPAASASDKPAAAPVTPPATASPPAAASNTPSQSASPPSTSPQSDSASQPAAPGPVASADPEAAARHDYVLAEDSGTKQAWDEFVKKYPSGYYHDLATQQMSKLAPDDAKAPPASPPPANTADAAPTDLAGFYQRGQQRAVHGDYALAAEDFTEVIKRDPRHAGALNDRCWVRALAGQLQDALSDCNAALQVAPKYPDALDSRGLVDLKLNLLTKAISDYSAALELDPKHASALYGRGIAKRRSGDAAGAKSDIDAAKAITPSIVDEFAGYGIK